MKNKIIYWTSIVAGPLAVNFAGNWHLNNSWGFSMLAYLFGITAGVFGHEVLKEKSS